MENTEQYSLKWNNHQSTVITAFNTLFNDEKHADCILGAEGQSIKVHKIMVSACSPYLEKLLEDYSIDKNVQPIIIFNDISFIELQALCKYMYKGEVNIPQDKLDSFLKVARMMQIKGLCDQQSSGENPPSKPPDKKKILLKRKRESDSETTDSSPAKPKPKGTPVATCSPVRINQNVVSQKETKVDEEQYDESNFQEYLGNDIYQETNLPGTSNDNLELIQWNEGSSEYSSQENSGRSEDMYCCLPCGKVYRKLKSLRSHLRYECGKDPEYACPHCPYKSKQRGYLNQHISVKHTSDCKVYVCDVCGYTSKYKSNYNIHIKSPSSCFKKKEEKGEFLCNSCGKVFLKESTLRSHMKNVCSSNTLFECPYCPFKARLKGNVTQHVKQKHNPSAITFNCGHCSFSTKQSRILKAHLANRHNDQYIEIDQEIKEEVVMAEEITEECQEVEQIEQEEHEEEEEEEGIEMEEVELEDVVEQELEQLDA